MTNQDKIKKIRENKLRDKFEPKPYSQEWRPMQILLQIVSFILQMGTGLMAGFFFFYGMQKLFGSFAVAIVCAAVFVIAFETVKRLLFAKASKFYYQERLKMGLKMSVCAFIVASISMSFFGTPLAVQMLSQKPSSPIMADVIAPLDTMERQAVAGWIEMADVAAKKAEDIHKKNNWRDVTTRAARPVVLQYEQQRAKAQDSITALKAIFASKKDALWAKAQELHQEQVREHEAELAVIGWIFAGVCLCLEMLFLLCVIWLIDFQYHEFSELAPLSRAEPLQPSKNGTKRVTKRVTKQEPKQKSIGFVSEGAITNDGKKFVIICKSKDGQLKPYSKSELSRNISNCRGDAKVYWESMKKRLDNHSK